METRSKDACQTAAADSTTVISVLSASQNSENCSANSIGIQQSQQQQQRQQTGVINAPPPPPPQQQQQVSSTSSAPKTNSPTPTNSGPNNNSSSNNNNNNATNKTKSQQQQQQYHQFRAPQQFVRHRRATIPVTLVNKKGKTWNKRQQRGAKQLQQQLQQQMLQSGNAVIGAGDGISVATGASATSKADLENIQNFKNQLGGHHYYQHGGGGGGGVGPGGGGGHRGIVGVNPAGGGSVAGGTGAGASGNGLPPAALANLEKLGYGHGHVKMHKKLLVHRGPGNHHHHVLCAGSAHNTIGGNANSNCCLVNGCNGGGGGHPNGKDTANGSTNSSQSGNTANSLHYCCSRSKFFLPDKRTRKEVIIPPTKFLLGGNISDPLNLNSLQNENSNASSNSNTPATTPRQSPITTPPKVEVIIPPNIHDPLHLLDPVDSMEYEKQLTSPMKRSGQRGGHAHHHSAKHRHRKNRKSKRRRHDSYQSSVGSASIGDSDMSALANSTLTTDAGSINLTSLSLSTTLSVASLLDSSANSSGPVGDGVKSNLNTISNEAQLVSTCENAPAEYRQQLEEREESKTLDSAAVDMACVAEERLGQRNSKSTSPIKQFANVVNSTFSGASLGTGEAVPSGGVGVLAASMAAVATTGSGVAGAVCGSAGGAEALASASAGGLFLPRERANRDLRLELNATTLSSLSGSTCGSGIGIGGGRKRKISESNNSQKNKKFHRDAMDKIVSPVVPQPGAWKRPPRLAATGARKPTRRSTSISETDVLSPADEVAKPLMNEADLLRVETPDFSKLETISEVGLASPLSTTSGATSVAAGEQESPMDTSAGDTSATMPTEDCPAAGDAAKSVADVPTASTSIAQLTKLPHFRADGVKYQYGNYDRYVGLRHLNELVDVRLQVFQRHLELFKNKDILDIGCNVGHMPITVARNFAPKSILGIDIDRKLVARARHNLALYVRIPTEPAVKALDASASIKKEEEKGEMKNEKVAASSAAGEIKTETVSTKDTANSAGDKMGPAADASVNKPKKTRRRKKSKHPTQQFGQQQQQHAQHQLQQQQQQHHHHHHHHMHHHHHNHYHYQQQQQALHVPATDLFPVSFPLTYGVIPTGKATASNATADAHSPSASINTPGHASNATPGSGGGGAANRKRKNEFPRNVFFRHQNYVLEDEAQLANDTQQYDLILCLSVTKWIHLNFGDAGLKMTFKRMFNQLRPGGKLILEAQNWASYKKKKNLTPQIYHNYRNIEFFPNKFHEYLLSSEVGFSHSYTLGVPRHLSKGFCRPIQLYAKGDYTPNHIRWSDAYYPQTPFEAYRGIYATMPPRPAGLASYAMSSTRSQAYDTPHYTGGTSGPYSCHQTPQPIYNPLETDSYLPSYDIGYLNHMYVFASPLYQTIWSPPASLRNSSSHTPVFGSVREAELDGDGGGSGGGGSYHRHVYPPNEDTSSPNANAGGAFSSIRDADTDDSNQLPAGGMQHVYATNCGESSSSPQVQHNNDSDALVEDALLLDDEQHVGQGQGQAVVAGGGTVANVTGTGNGELHVASGAVGQEGGQHYCDLNDA